MVKTRFAPSPTGYLHIGGARTALFNWLFARHTGGSFVLRIEDTDLERSKDEYVKDILDGLTWLGIDWDEPPCFQRERIEIYRDYAFNLIEKGLAYRCYCTQEELDEKRKVALKEGKKPHYDRTCRERPVEKTDKPFVIRFKTPLTGAVTFSDIVRGTITFQCEELDDLVILRSDLTPTYNFTVVIDDMLMGITHVIRGDDHINNTPRQILIYHALDYAPPQFAHVPLIHGKDRTRLSKRHGATSLLEYKHEGFLPEALMNYLARLGWAYGDQEIFSRAELIERFDLQNVGTSAAIFDMDKLLWLNSHYMKALPQEIIAWRLVPFIEAMGITVKEGQNLFSIVTTLRARAKTLKEMAHMAAFFFSDSVSYEKEAQEKFLTPETKPILEHFLAEFRALPSLHEEEQKRLVENLTHKYNKKVVEIVQPIRVALSGRTVTPGIFEVITILGREQVERRIEKAIQSIP